MDQFRLNKRFLNNTRAVENVTLSFSKIWFFQLLNNFCKNSYETTTVIYDRFFYKVLYPLFDKILPSFFHFQRAVTSLWLYNFINVLHHTTDTWDLIYLRKFTHAHAASFKKTYFYEVNIDLKE